MKNLGNLNVAIDVIRHFNKMEFSVFVKEFESWRGEKFLEETKEKWPYCGLDNVSFFKLYT